MPGLPFTLSPSADVAWAIDEVTATVTATAAARTDMFIDPGADSELSAESTLNAATLLGVPPDGDFQFSARVTVNFESTFDAGVLLVWIDDRHWGKLCFEYSPDREPMIVSVVTRGVSDDANAFVVDGRTVWLRVSRIDHAFAYHASLDGKNWQLIRFFAIHDRPRPPPSASRHSRRPVTAASSPSTTSASPASACASCGTAHDSRPGERNRSCRRQGQNPASRVGSCPHAAADRTARPPLNSTGTGIGTRRATPLNGCEDGLVVRCAPTLTPQHHKFIISPSNRVLGLDVRVPWWLGCLIYSKPLWSWSRRWRCSSQQPAAAVTLRKELPWMASV